MIGLLRVCESPLSGERTCRTWAWDSAGLEWGVRTGPPKTIAFGGPTVCVGGGGLGRNGARKVAGPWNPGRGGRGSMSAPAWERRQGAEAAPEAVEGQASDSHLPKLHFVCGQTMRISSRKPSRMSAMHLSIACLLCIKATQTSVCTGSTNGNTSGLCMASPLPSSQNIMAPHIQFFGSPGSKNGSKKRFSTSCMRPAPTPWI